MSVYKVTVQRPVAVSMAVLGVIVFGAIAYRQLPLNLMPQMNYPRLTIRTEYAGSGPEEIELELTRPIEGLLGTVSNLQRMTSRSRAGLSEVMLEFDWKVNMDLAMQEVREKLDLLRRPEGAKGSILLRYDPNLDPMLRLGLWGKKANLFRMRRYAEDVLKPALETLPGVAAVKIRGGLEKEVEVALNEKKLSRLNLKIASVVKRLKEENINLAGGRLKEGSTYYWVRTLNEFKSLSEMGEMIVEERDNRQIRLKDVATLRFHAKDQEVLTRVNGQVSIELAVYREADANIVEVSQRVKDRIFGTAQQRAYVIKLAQQRRKGGKGKAPRSWRKRRPPPRLPKKRTTIAKTKTGKGTKAKGKRGGKKGRKGRKGRKGKWGRGRWAKMRAARMKKRRQRQMTRFLLYELPPQMNLKVLQDQAVFIKASIDEVLQAAFVGGGFAVLVLLLFLRRLWSTVIIGLSIPLSVVATFAGLYLSKVSLNIMSLGGLALGIGMLVDNSIVVLESIVRFREDGHSVAESAVLGVSEVGGAVTASTLTTVAVFFPIVFVQGVAGQLLRDLALTVVLSLLSSLFVSLFFIPMLSALRWPGLDESDGQGQETVQPAQPLWPPQSWIRVRESLRWWKQGWDRGGFRRLVQIPLLLLLIPYLAITFALQLFIEIIARLWQLSSWLTLRIASHSWQVLSFVGRWAAAPFFWLMDRFLGALHWFYPRFLRRSLNNGIVVLAACLGLGVLSYFLLPQLKREFMPRVHQGEFNVELTFPVGTPLLQTARRLSLLEQEITDMPEVKELTTVVGIEKTEVQNADKGEHSATLTLRLHPTRDVKATEESVIEQLRRTLQQVPGVRMKVVYPSLFTLRTPIEVEIKGERLLVLRRLAKQSLRDLSNIPSLRDVRSSAVGGLPEIQIRYDRERLLRYGISVKDVAEAVRNKVYGAVATRFRQQERRLDVLVRVNRPQLNSVRELLNLTIHNAQGVPISLRQIAKLRVDEGPSEILRVSNQRSVILSAELSGMALGEATRSIEDTLSALNVPSGYSVGLSGQSEEMERSLRSLLYALLLSIFLVYLVMASQFESLLSPVVILGSVPLAFIGVVLFLWLLRFPVSVMVLIGLIILVGIVVNNAIVLVDAINRLRQRGLELADAVVQAGQLRLRPILMTTATTVLGLVPLALGLGEGAELRRPMAITIIIGLLFSTLLTLVVIPVIYQMVMRRLPPPSSYDEEWVTAPPQSDTLPPAGRT